MNKATLGMNLTVAAQSWSISSNYNAVGTSGQLQQWVEWAFKEGCRRLQAPGNAGDLVVTFAVIGHADQRRVGDETAELVTHVTADAARLLILHLALETITHMVQNE